MKTFLLPLTLAVVTVVASVSGAAAQWTTVGSTGTVDEADLAEFEVVGPQARIRNTAPLPASVVIRYNVVAIPETDGEGLGMTVRYLDDEAGARVVSVLRRVNIATGAIATVLTLDSDSFVADSGFQTRTIGSCDLGLNFADNAYFIETTLTKSTATATPRIMAIKLTTAFCR